AAQLERCVLRPQQLDQFVVDDFDDLLAWLNALNDLLADRLLLDALDEITGDLEMDVGIQQRHPHLAQGLCDVGLGNLAESAQVSENVLELAAQRIEHTSNVRTSVQKHNPESRSVQGLTLLRPGAMECRTLCVTLACS